MLAIIAVILVVGAAIAGAYRWRSEQGGDAKQAKIVAQVIALVAKDQLGEAFTAARPLLNDERVRALPEFAAAWKQVVLPMRPVVTEPGAAVYFKTYDDIDGEWIQIGTTPIAKFVEAPRAALRIKIEKPGYRTGYFVVANPGPSAESDPPDPGFVDRFEYVPLPLSVENAIPDDMIVVPRTNFAISLPGWTSDLRGNNKLDLPSFAIDREETTNRQFKDFVDAGGYNNPTYWEELEFREKRRTLSWEEARKRFIDSTGRPGPAGWQLSTFPSDEEDLPVGGISWYEAAAYAKFRGKELPTVHHWYAPPSHPTTRTLMYRPRSR